MKVVQSQSDWSMWEEVKCYVRDVGSPLSEAEARVAVALIAAKLGGGPETWRVLRLLLAVAGPLDVTARG